MTNQRSIQLRSKPWIEWCANRIDDPMVRLKFLRTLNPSAVNATRTRRRWVWRFGMATVMLLAVFGSIIIVRAAARARISPVAIRPKLVHHPPSPAVAPVWLVDKSPDSETYSNGLRIDTRFESPSHPRAYLAFPVDRPTDITSDTAGVRRTAPAGIVFHTTESPQLPFEASANSGLKQVGESLIEYVRRRHAYHFLIDRFGRVYRTVPESDEADHAGPSIWRDDDWLYLNLNESFLGYRSRPRPSPDRRTPPSARRRSIRRRC